MQSSEAIKGGYHFHSPYDFNKDCSPLYRGRRFERIQDKQTLQNAIVPSCKRTIKKITQFIVKWIKGFLSQLRNWGRYLQNKVYIRNESPSFIGYFDSKKEVGQKSQFETVIDTIRKDAETDLYLDERYIEKKYGIKGLIKSLSANKKKICREKLNQVINEAYLKRFLQDRMKICVSPFFEERTLWYLGFNIYDGTCRFDKEAIYDAFSKTTKKELKAEHFKLSVASFRKLLEEYALRARLEEVGIIDKLQKAKFKVVLSLVQEMADKFISISLQIPLTFPPSFPLDSSSLGVQAMEEIFQRHKRNQLGKSLARAFCHPDVIELFWDDHLDLHFFKKKLNELISSQEESERGILKSNCEDLSLREDLQHFLDLYSKWGQYLKAEMIQGLTNDDEMLTSGVCSAVCFRLLGTFQFQPDERITGKLSIEAIDRFKQALYYIKPYLYFQTTQEVSSIEEALELDQNYEKFINEIPEEWLKVSKFRTINRLAEIENLDYETMMKDWTHDAQNINQLEESNGWANLALTNREGCGHDMLMRLDHKRQKAWFFDPNFGLFCFEAPGKAFDQSVTDCIECFFDFFYLQYGRYTKLTINQLLPK